MSNISPICFSFPKVWALGTKPIQDIFNDSVELTEKIDGSQIGFGMFDGQLWVRSKRAKGIQDDPPKMFKPTIDHIESVQHYLIPGAMYWGEALYAPKHNTVAYSRCPEGHLILFAVQYPDGEFGNWHSVADEAQSLQCDVVYLLFQGKWSWAPSVIADFLEQESCLGGSKIEGVVVKNYAQDYSLGGQYVPFMAGKFVSEKFKEKHKVETRSNSGKGQLEKLCEAYRNENRWAKAVQHLREAGRLEETPRDIGELIKEVKRDIQEEEREEIKERLWKIFGEEIIRNSIKGFAEWYKEQLLTQESEV